METPRRKFHYRGGGSFRRITAGSRRGRSRRRAIRALKVVLDTRRFALLISSSFLSRSSTARHFQFSLCFSFCWCYFLFNFSLSEVVRVSGCRCCRRKKRGKRGRRAHRWSFGCEYGRTANFLSLLHTRRRVERVSVCYSAMSDALVARRFSQPRLESQSHHNRCAERVCREIHIYANYYCNRSAIVQQE